MTDEKIIITPAKIHRIMKSLQIARVSQGTGDVLAKYINELIETTTKEAHVLTQHAGRTTISEKDMILAIQQKCPDFTFETKE